MGGRRWEKEVELRKSFPYSTRSILSSAELIGICFRWTILSVVEKSSSSSLTSPRWWWNQRINLAILPRVLFFLYKYICSSCCTHSTDSPSLGDERKRIGSPSSANVRRHERRLVIRHRSERCDWILWWWWQRLTRKDVFFFPFSRKRRCLCGGRRTYRVCGNRWEYNDCLSLSQSIIHHQHERELNRGWRREGSHWRDDDDDPKILFFDTIQPPRTQKRSGGSQYATAILIEVHLLPENKFIYLFRGETKKIRERNKLLSVG